MKNRKFVFHEIKSAEKLIHLKYTNLNALVSFGVTPSYLFYRKRMSQILEKDYVPVTRFEIPNF